MATKKGTRTKKAVTRRSRRSRAKTPRFVGRDPSPVLDRYPPRETASSSRTPASVSPPPTPAVPLIPRAPATAAPAGGPAQPLITLERPFDVDEFSTLLGGTSIRVVVPREALPEVLRRVLEFMGFGIYVYAISLRPSPSELLKSFVLELHRVDYSTAKGVWTPFEEKGSADSPFGPVGGRA
jgi:hypothetical protein